MKDSIDPLEKKIIGIAFLVMAVQVSLIAFAAYKLGLSVPTCVTNVKPFDSGSFTKIGDHRYEIHVLAKMWGFEPNKIDLPPGSIADIYITSKDVTHGFHINGTNVNLMAVPGVVNYAQVTFNHPGTYPFVCHEYCGAGHQAMNGMVLVSDHPETENPESVSSAVATAVATSVATVSPGSKLVQDKGCIACHTSDGKPSVGPTFKGIWGRSETFTNGTTLVVDAAYIKESILDPPKKVVKGFNPIMPKLPVSDTEIDQIIDYLKTLK